MKSFRNPLLLTLLLGGVIGYIAACNNSRPTADANAQQTDEPEPTLDANPASPPLENATAAPAQDAGANVAPDAAGDNAAETNAPAQDQVALASNNTSAGHDEGATKTSAKQPWEREVYFGEQHMHTRNSFDAFTAGVKQTWEDAYRFAMGEAIALSTTGQKMKRRTPYDFVAITDHSEYYGVLKDLIDPASPLSKSEFAKGLQEMETDPAAAGPAVQKLIQTLVQNNPMKEYVTPEQRVGSFRRLDVFAE